MPVRNRRQPSQDKSKQPRTTDAGREQPQSTGLDTSRRTGCLTHSQAIRLLAVARLLAAVFSNISDCDEVFNYWEPAHYLQYGTGFQTWEYAPQYAIRSWAYILLHAIIAGTFELGLAHHKIQVFYMTRAALSLISAATESMLYDAVATHIHPRVANYLLVVLLFSPGMFVASSAFLPSTFAMYASTWAFAWMLKSPETRWRTWSVAVLSAIAALWGWPFAAALAIPFAIHELFVLNLQRIVWMIEGAIVAAVAVLVPLALIDHFFYQKWVVAPLNIVLYNVFGGKDRGPDIYGTEPWHFYLLNGTLNFNIMFTAALVSLPVLIINSFVSPQLVKENTSKARSNAIQLCMRIAPTYLWLAIFSYQPHKEERFLFVVYPQLCFCAAVTIYFARGMLEMAALNVAPLRSYAQRIVKTTTYAVFSIFIALSLLRIRAGYVHYYAPQDVYANLLTAPPPQWPNASNNPANHTNATVPVAQQLGRQAIVCVGKEWYRFSSHYFLPTGMRLEFLRSSFHGQLPQHFSQDATITSSLAELLSQGRFDEYAKQERRQPRSFSTIVTNVNDVNAEEPDRYVSLGACDYLVDTVPQDTDGIVYDPDADEPWYAMDSATWSRVACTPFLDATKSSMIPRTLGLPFGRRVWMDYCLLVRNQTQSPDS